MGWSKLDLTRSGNAETPDIAPLRRSLKNHVAAIVGGKLQHGRTQGAAGEQCEKHSAREAHTPVQMRPGRGEENQDREPSLANRE